MGQGSSKIKGKNGIKEEREGTKKKKTSPTREREGNGLKRKKNST